ncbi:YhdH/YhfP family quinone oxidoreductase [Sediminitomix flava]|uniref:Putative YhdH/YhfP family quinone oxidoreductase n=1 Tax=Sediminitomix flava TaxID=379075 RepID=A0A315Z938_SEDFL|nr:YhdH/YhfP family quinone oxidoreductase [Sediminitomix flava]PWJ42075.1 putative YhdH/YhfP family quinone oxidoreductase [Sediminitomix flava]
MTKTENFKALVIKEEGENFIRSIEQKSIDELPEGDVLVEVMYSSLNYKDALSAIGNKGVTRNYPHTPGIDAVGKVDSSNNDKFKEGDEVIVTSYDLGMNTSGGFGQYIRVPSDWVLKLPTGLSMKEAMAYGTAGLTAAMSVFKLVEQIKPEDGKIIVSGATGGVGSMSVAFLSKLGYDVVAITGKADSHEFLKNLGASEIISRDEIGQEEKRPMLRSQFAGAVDTVGGVILENIIKQTNPMGVVTSCGNVASPKLNLTVFPFILRGVSLVGIDSQNFPMSLREKVWQLMATDWKPDALLDIVEEVSLDQINEKIDLILKGQVSGRVVLNLTK